MTKDQAIRYIDLVDRRIFILNHSGVDWKPEYGPELRQIDMELHQLAAGGTGTQTEGTERRE